MVTEECLLDASRNKGLTKADKEQLLKAGHHQLRCTTRSPACCAAGHA
jgi:hypothetical protein